MRKLLAFFVISGSLWAAGPCNSPANYSVGAGETYSTIAAAINAVKSACGTSNFGATQTILIDPGTYVESAILGVTSLKPTATARLVIKRSGTTTQGYSSGYWPIISISGGGSNCIASAANTDWKELEFTGCQDAIAAPGTSTGITFSRIYIHDVTGNAGVYMPTTPGAVFDHIRIHKVPRGMSLYSDTIVSSVEIDATTQINSTTLANGASITGAIVYNGGSGVTGIFSSLNGTISNCVVYETGYGIQTGNQALITILNSIEVSNNDNGHCEAGSSGNCHETRNHGFQYGAKMYSELWADGTTSGVVAGITRLSNIAWANYTVNHSVAAYNSRIGTTTAAISQDYNVFPPSVGYYTGLVQYRYYASDINGSQAYTTLATWQAGTLAAGHPLDQHSIEGVDPRIIGNKELLTTTAQVCTSVPTSASDPFGTDARLRCIQANYMPTNLALKKRGNGGSDPGPVAMTVFATPGANMSTSIAAPTTFSGGVAF